jgi:hypothetical protein
MPIALLVIAFGTAAAASSKQPDAAPPVVDEEGAPPGSAEDRALWTNAHATSTRIITERAQAAKLQATARNRAYEAGLAALAERLGGDAARRASGVRARLLETWRQSAELLVVLWPVDVTRGCRYPALNLESVMYERDGARKEAQLRGARMDVQECIDKAAVPLSAILRSNEEFRAVLAEAERVLAESKAEAAR